jgi:hypothetical protein
VTSCCIHNRSNAGIGNRLNNNNSNISTDIISNIRDVFGSITSMRIVR